MIGIIILAIVQGISEFLPISSSAHLIIFRDILGVGTEITPSIELAFDIALHFGTLLAILIFFFKDWLDIVIGFFKGKSKMLIYLIIATIPAALAGILLEDVIDGVIRGNTIVMGLALLIVGVILYYVDQKSALDKEIKDVTMKDALYVGIAQTFALIPGVSRSGATITAGRKLGMDREASAKFSFYLSAPVIAGAALVTLLKDNTINTISNNLNFFVVGIIVSFITGLMVIKYLLKYIKNNDFKPFMWYRVLIGIILIIITII